MTTRVTDFKPVTVLHVIAHMEKGGAERQLSLLVDASRHRHVIAVLPGNERPSAATVERLPGLSPRAIFRNVRGMIRKYDVDIVQLWLPDRITIPAMFAARREGCRIISGDRRSVRNYGKFAIRDRVAYVNHLFADLVIPNYPHFSSRLSLRRLLGIPARTRTILNGIDLSPAARPIRTVPTRLLMVGRLVEQKRVGPLLQALPDIIANTGISGLDIVGDGPEEPNLRKKTEELGLSADVAFHGHRTNWGTMFDPATHFLVLPSVSEGMSNTIFEAISQGFLPIVRESRELTAILADWDAQPVMVDMSRDGDLRVALATLTAGKPEAIAERVRALRANLWRISIDRMAAAYDTAYDQLVPNLGMRNPQSCAKTENSMVRLRERVVFFATMPNEKKGLTGAVVGTSTVKEAIATQAEVEVVERRHSRIRVAKRGISVSAIVSFFTDYMAALSALRKRLAQSHDGSTTLYLSAASSLGGSLRDIGAILLARPGTRVVLHSRNGDFFYPKGIILRTLRRWELKHADRVICLSRRLLPNDAALARLMPPGAGDRIRVVPNTIDDALVATLGELEKKASRDAPFSVLYMSNFIPSKGFLLLAEAIRQIERAGRLSEFRFTFRGNWPDPALEDTLRSALGEKVLSSGVVEIGAGIWDRAEVRATLLRADVFCLPTSYPAEAQPRSILEAMACGCVIVATDHASIGDMVIPDENGALVRPGSARDIADYLLSITRETLSQQGATSRALFEARFARTKHDAAIRETLLWY